MKDRKLPGRLRAKLKQPFGELLEGSPEENTPRLKAKIENLNPTLIAAVGDVVSQMLNESGVKAKLYVTDGKIMRRNVGYHPIQADKILKTRNPPGTISGESFRILSEAAEHPGTIWVQVEGEEDLLVLPLTLVLPEKSVIIYGQPGRGLVLVQVDKDKKKEAQTIIESMETT